MVAGDIIATITASGVIKPRIEEIVSSEINSRVVQVLARAGYAAIVIEGPGNGDFYKIVVSKDSVDIVKADELKGLGNYDTVEKLRGEPAGLGAGGQTPHITLQGAEPRVSGFAGCNQISGGYTLAGDQLSFGQMAMTKRACPEGMELEREFAKALEETKSCEVSDDVLQLRDEDGTVIAELKAGSS